MYLRFKTLHVEDMGIDIVSVGNLNVGGSGKTPLVTALSLHYENAAIVLRGYNRQSRGLIVVKNRNEILCDVTQSGDEAMIYADKVPFAIVIVSEDRKAGIKKAKELGAKIVFLDDAYSKHDIKKFDILIEVKTPNNNCLPSGAFRERLWSKKEAFILKDGVDFRRFTTIKDRCDKMSLFTAIARPQRLDEYLPKVVGKNYFEDHHQFSKDELIHTLKKDGAESLLVTYKDYVKVKEFGLPLSLLDLHVEVDDKVFQAIDNYIHKDALSASKD